MGGLFSGKTIVVAKAASPKKKSAKELLMEKVAAKKASEAQKEDEEKGRQGNAKRRQINAAKKIEDEAKQKKKAAKKANKRKEDEERRVANEERRTINAKNGKTAVKAIVPSEATNGKKKKPAFAIQLFLENTCDIDDDAATIAEKLESKKIKKVEDLVLYVEDEEDFTELLKEVGYVNIEVKKIKKGLKIWEERKMEKERNNKLKRERKRENKLKAKKEKEKKLKERKERDDVGIITLLNDVFCRDKKRTNSSLESGSERVSTSASSVERVVSSSSTTSERITTPPPPLPSKRVTIPPPPSIVPPTTIIPPPSPPVIIPIIPPPSTNIIPQIMAKITPITIPTSPLREEPTRLRITSSTGSHVVTSTSSTDSHIIILRLLTVTVMAKTTIAPISTPPLTKKPTWFSIII